jgi:hypothetical protein
MAVLMPLLNCPTALAQGLFGDPTTRPTKVLPEFKYDGTLDGAIAKLQEADPSLRVMVVWPTGAATDEPHISLALRNVTAVDVLDVMATAYQAIGIKIVSAASGEIYIINVQVQPSEQRRRGGRGADPVNGGGGGAPQQYIVRVYNLAGPVNAWINDNLGPVKDEDFAAAKGKAMDAILSLLQATLTQLPDETTKPLLQVHEPTVSVVFRGSPRQLEAVEEAMHVLPGYGSSLSRQRSNDLTARVAALEKEISQLKSQNASGARGK